MQEIQNVLSFSLKTAEQSLAETAPHVVQKLHEGRDKRLKLLEKSQAERRRDLDQRSSQTCMVNSEHLQGFNKKAKVRKEAAEKKRVETLELLQKTLLMDMDIDMKEGK